MGLSLEEPGLRLPPPALAHLPGHDLKEGRGVRIHRDRPRRSVKNIRKAHGAFPVDDRIEHANGLANKWGRSCCQRLCRREEFGAVVKRVLAPT